MLQFVAAAMPLIVQSCREFDDQHNWGKPLLEWRVHHMHAVHERGLAAAIEEAFILASGDKAEEWRQSTGRPYAACFDYCYWEHRQDMSLFRSRLQPTLPAYEQLIKGLFFFFHSHAMGGRRRTP